MDVSVLKNYPMTASQMMSPIGLYLCQWKTAIRNNSSRDTITVEAELFALLIRGKKAKKDETGMYIKNGEDWTKVRRRREIIDWYYDKMLMIESKALIKARLRTILESTNKLPKTEVNYSTK